MNSRIVLDNIDLLKDPSPEHIEKALSAIREQGPDPLLVLGDLHGNALKLCCYLRSVNMLSSIDYLQLAALYKAAENDFKIIESFRNHQHIADQLQLNLGTAYSSSLIEKQKPFKEALLNIGLTEPFTYDQVANYCRQKVKRHLDNFSAVLEKITINNPYNIRLLLLGDELGDRGCNDFFTLKLFEKLHSSPVTFNICLSDHSAEFIRAIEQHDMNISSFQAIIGPSQVNSLANLGFLLDTKLLTKEKLHDLYHTAYLPHLKILDATFSQEPRSLTYFVHSPIGVETIISIAYQIGSQFKANTPEEFMSSVNGINQKFQEMAQNGAITKFTKLKEFMQKNLPIEAASYGFPVIRLMWTRRSTGGAIDSINQKIDPIDPVYNGYEINIVHGHDSKATYKLSNVINLDEDNQIGKAAYREFDRGNLHFVVSRKSPTLLLQNTVTSSTEERTLQLPNISNPSSSSSSNIDTPFAEEIKRTIRTYQQNNDPHALVELAKGLIKQPRNHHPEIQRILNLAEFQDTKGAIEQTMKRLSLENQKERSTAEEPIAASTHQNNLDETSFKLNK